MKIQIWGKINDSYLSIVEIVIATWPLLNVLQIARSGQYWIRNFHLANTRANSRFCHCQFLAVKAPRSCADNILLIGACTYIITNETCTPLHMHEYECPSISMKSPICNAYHACTNVRISMATFYLWLSWFVAIFPLYAFCHSCEKQAQPAVSIRRARFTTNTCISMCSSLKRLTVHPLHAWIWTYSSTAVTMMMIVPNAKQCNNNNGKDPEKEWKK